MTPGAAGLEERLRADVAALAGARGAGTAGEARARARVANSLRALGLDAREEAFGYDPRFVRHGTTAALALVFSLFVAAPFSPYPLGIGGLAFALGLAVALLAARGIPPLSERVRVRTANLVARAERGPAFVLLAHLDTKSQRLSFALRTAASIDAMVFGALFVILAAFGVGGAPLVVAGLLAALASGALAISGHGDRSPGALDNASGVAVLLELARRLGGSDVEYVVTSAEEDGLVGAERYARAHGSRLREAGALVVNLDTIGPGGGFALVRHANRTGERRLADAFDRAAAVHGASLRRRRVPFPGGVDAYPIARAGVSAVTLASGSITETFAHVHRPSDDVARVDGARLRVAASLVEAVARDLGAGGTPSSASGAG